MALTGFVNIIKPTGESSSNVVCKVKKILNTKKVGHLGTLDPAASGVLPLAVGRATKFFDYFLNKDKEYVALVEFGKTTDTLDSYGEVLETNNNFVTSEMINAVINEFVGVIDQTPPKYSAIKVNGKRAYELARENANFEIKSRKITIFSIKLVKNCEKNRFLFKVHCSAGTYIRTLFDDIAKKLNTISYTPVIIRTKSGLFNIENAVTLDELENNKKISSIEDIFSNFTKIEVNDFIAKKLINGQKLSVKDLGFKTDIEGDFFVTYNGQLIGMYEIVDDSVKLKIYLYE